MSKELKGALFFSDRPPHITGYLVIAGTEYEIGGWRVSEVRADISARRRGERKQDQDDMFEEAQERDRERGRWAALGPTKQAGIRCKEPVFWRFLEEEHRYRDVTCEQHAADCVLITAASPAAAISASPADPKSVGAGTGSTINSKLGASPRMHNPTGGQAHDEADEAGSDAGSGHRDL